MSEPNKGGDLFGETSVRVTAVRNGERFVVYLGQQRIAVLSEAPTAAELVSMGEARLRNDATEELQRRVKAAYEAFVR